MNDESVIDKFVNILGCPCAVVLDDDFVAIVLLGEPELHVSKG